MYYYIKLYYYPVYYIVHYHVLVCEYFFKYFWSHTTMLTFNVNKQFFRKKKINISVLKIQSFSNIRLWLSVSIGLRISDKRSSNGIQTICKDVNPLSGWRNAEDVTSLRWRPCSSPLSELPCAGWFKLLPAVSNYSSEKLRNQYQIKANLFSFFFSPFRSRKQTAGVGGGWVLEDECPKQRWDESVLWRYGRLWSAWGTEKKGGFISASSWLWWLVISRRLCVIFFIPHVSQQWSPLGGLGIKSSQIHTLMSPPPQSPHNSQQPQPDSSQAGRCLLLRLSWPPVCLSVWRHQKDAQDFKVFSWIGGSSN